MDPHSDHFNDNDAVLFQHLIDKSVLDVDPARIDACEIANQLFVGRRVLKRIFSKNIQ